VRSDSDLHEPRTNAEQSETGGDFRVSYESQRMTKPRAQRRRVMWIEADEKTGKPVLVSLTPDGMDDEEYLATLHQMADQFDADAFCYFIGAASGPVKIGFAVNVGRRLRDLQNACPLPLALLASVRGGQTREQAYHYRFHEFRLHGEWFERSPEILAEIDRLNADAPKGGRDAIR
jgi:hypothetical protein